MNPLFVKVHSEEHFQKALCFFFWSSSVIIITIREIHSAYFGEFLLKIMHNSLKKKNSNFPCLDARFLVDRWFDTTVLIVASRRHSDAMASYKCFSSKKTSLTILTNWQQKMKICDLISPRFESSKPYSTWNDYFRVTWPLWNGSRTAVKCFQISSHL